MVVIVETVVGIVMVMRFDVLFSTLIHSVGNGVVAVTSVDSKIQDAIVWNDLIGCVFIRCVYIR